MTDEEFEAAHGVGKGENRTLHLRDGSVLTGTIAGTTIKSVSGAMSLEMVNVTLSPSGDTVGVRWDAVSVVAARPIEGWS